MAKLEGRKSTSKRWVALPGEFLEKVQESLTEQFGRTRRWAVAGAIFPEEICLRAGYREGSSIRPFNFEVSLDRAPSSNTKEDIHVGLDYLGALFEKHFTIREANEDEPPLLWEKAEFEGRPIFFKHSTINDELESAADRLLGEDKDDDQKLTQGEWEES